MHTDRCPKFKSKYDPRSDLSGDFFIHSFTVYSTFNRKATEATAIQPLT